MGRILKILGIGLVVSLFYFSFGVTFLPPNINTKMIIALFGMLTAVYHAIQNRSVKISRPLLGAIGFVVLFSIICFVSSDYNHTDDLSYATYFVSFAVWIFAAYAVCTLIKWGHGVINLTLLTFYLAGVCFTQCALALLIDSIPAFQQWVNQYIDQGQDFLLEVNRLYGIGASLDNAGVRFSIVLIMMAGILSKEQAIRTSSWSIIVLLTGFFTIIIIGNMISRTTSTGAGLAILYLMWNTGIVRMIIKPNFFKFHLIFGFMLILALLITTYFYQSDSIFQGQIRFAFEGFFNWIEYGEWRTGSTDKLNNNMWVWPTDLKTWIIGTGLFDNWVFGTDIGYCRLIMYSGLVGFSVFSLFFIYNAAVFARKYRQYSHMFFLFFVLTFVVWIKVSTDIFLIYALFYCMDILRNNKTLNQQDENRLLHTRYI
ncbi:hypothetical protein N180_00695 [Pedobacter antarcticus 4BY]|uniref:Uncharacterized protein n=2 Tax=Pedobacter antarcticus TaxID=34086 RepID=A0A081PBW5_9SPHI|nr:hypothetical protein [Pedobacter antarcticus]KEQ28188.1 hypothetical protein N180_00695 [Pedobacter antarcticus 4BY]SFE44803.1 hypothetical protein SAMN03003324_00506 [Pedobacter antarcticus]